MRNPRLAGQATLDGSAETHLEKGYINDYVTGKVLRDTPEERVRQQFERTLERVYGYDKNQMMIEFHIQRGSASGKERADIVVFRDDKGKTQADAYVIVETEPPEHQYDLQLLSYVTATPAEFAVWTNGKEIRYFYMSPKHPRKFVPIPDIPKRGLSLEDVGKYKKDQLVPALDLKNVFDRIHNFIYVNQGLRHDQIFQELLKLIFCKIQDEKNLEETCYFRVTQREAEEPEGKREVHRRIVDLFNQVKKRYSTVFEDNEKVLLEPHVITYAVGELQKYSLLNTDVDTKGTAFETIIGANLRGERGEYFTPREVCRMMVEMLDPQPYQTILDPAAGSGGFLITVLAHMRKEIEKAAKNGLVPARKVEELKMETGEKYVFGIDFNPLLAKTTKMNMVMNDASPETVFTENSLTNYDLWSHEARTHIKPESISAILTNPPMGAKAKIFEKETLQDFDLGHKWEARNGAWILTSTVLVSQVPEMLFAERCLDLLAVGGKMGIVMTRGMLSNEKNPTVRAFREYIKRRAKVLAVVDLPRETFLPHTGTLTSALFLEKKGPSDVESDYPIFMAVADRVGHDKRGNPVFERDPQGNLILDSEGKPAVDNDLPKIAYGYRNFLQEGGLGKGFGITFAKLQSRLDATYYSPSKSELTGRIEELAAKHEWQVASISEVSERIFFPDRFKRIYVSAEEGVPFLSGADILQWDFTNVKHLSKSTEKLEQLLVKKDWILVTRSGTVGVVVKVPEFLDQTAITEHVIRIIPDKEKIDPGYLYVLLSSELGTTLLKPGIHGSVVDEITPEYIGSLKIPLLRMEEQVRIGKLVQEADKSLTNAFRKVGTAKASLLDYFSSVGLRVRPEHDE